MRRFGGMTRAERVAAAGQPGVFAPVPLPLQHAVTDNRRLITVPWAMVLRWIAGRGTQTYAEATHAERVDPDPKNPFDPADYRPGAWLYETDRSVLYQTRIVADEAVWVYVAGTMRGTLSPDQKPADLTAAGDTGFLFHSTDFAHTYRWNGTAWRYAVEEGDPGSGWIGWWTVAPNNNGVWQLCDGATVTRSLNAGGTASVTVPNLIGSYPKGASAYTGSSVPAIAPGLSGQTASDGAHTHTLPTMLTDGAGSSVTVQGGTGATAVPPAHQHFISTPYSTGSAGAHTHGPGTLTVSATGEPAHIGLLPYYRR